MLECIASASDDPVVVSVKHPSFPRLGTAAEVASPVWCQQQGVQRRTFPEKIIRSCIVPARGASAQPDVRRDAVPQASHVGGVERAVLVLVPSAEVVTLNVAAAPPAVFPVLLHP